MRSTATLFCAAESYYIYECVKCDLTQRRWRPSNFHYVFLRKNFVKIVFAKHISNLHNFSRTVCSIRWKLLRSEITYQILISLAVKHVSTFNSSKVWISSLEWSAPICYVFWFDLQISTGIFDCKTFRINFYSKSVSRRSP